MGKLGTVTFAGASGTRYPFIAYSLDTILKEVGAAYAFTKRAEDLNGGHSHAVIDIGQTSNVSQRCASRRNMPCIKRMHANCICVCAQHRESVRLRTEGDLIAGLHPPCND